MKAIPFTGTSEAILDTASITDAARLAQTAIETSSFFALRGARGTGKTFIYDVITEEWAAKKVGCSPFYFRCTLQRDSEKFIRAIAFAITGRKHALWERPSLHELISLVGDTCRKHESTFLFVDNLHLVSDGCGEMLLSLFDSLRDDDVRIGMAITTRAQTVELLDAQTHPAFLDTIWISAFNETENLDLLSKWEPRLQPMVDEYFEGKPDGAAACRIAWDATKGNFKAMRGFLETILLHCPPGPISLKELENCLHLRRVSSIADGNFKLVA